MHYRCMQTTNSPMYFTAIESSYSLGMEQKYDIVSTGYIKEGPSSPGDMVCTLT